MPDSLRSPKWAWIDGEFVAWADCKLHVRSQAVMAGASVFEGIRAYWNDQDSELQIFRLRDHLQRLWDSMRIMRMSSPIATDLEAACVELLARNEFREDVHFMPFAYCGWGEDFGTQSPTLEEGLFITAIAKPQSKALTNGLNVCVSSWRRIDDTVMPPRVKAAANYQNSRLALLEARANHYDYSILLNSRGTVAEGPGACIFMVRNGEVSTPPVTAGILESITRATLIQLFKERLGIDVIQRDIDRTELYLAEELFYTGTGSEVTPIVSVDRMSIGTGQRGAVAESIQKIYFAIARGADDSHGEWRTPVYQSSMALKVPLGEDSQSRVSSSA